MSGGAPEPLGVTADIRGVNVAVRAAAADAILFCLFDASGQREIARHRLPERTGDVFHGHIRGVAPGARYGLRAAGPWDPAHGHRFNPAKLLVDPHAIELDRPFALHRSLFDRDRPNPEDSAPFVPKAVIGRIEPMHAPRGAPASLSGLVIYELHVRGFTMLNPEIPRAIRGTFAALAHPAAIAHLRRLGVSAVQLMPSAAWIDERHLPPLGLTNYWGYNPVVFCAPDKRLAPGGWAEIRSAVGALRTAGMAVLLDVVLNHTGEGDALGPTLSLRGLDNATYYRLDHADPARYIDDTGCGNSLALDRPATLRVAMDALRAWALRAGIDGFRFDLATALARREDGFDPFAPLLAAIAQDPVVRELILIAEPWDIGPGGHRLGTFPPPWGEWNDRFRDTVRRFWRGEPGLVGDLATRIAGSPDILAPRHRPLSSSINFVTAHDGFTLADLVSYERKHNEANGEDNRDGSDGNHSWNHGVEGPADDAAVAARRRADVRAMLASLLCARGTPMLTMGDECGRTQQGNNNAYSQDNAISWFDWTGMDEQLVAFTARLVAARRAHAALSDHHALAGAPADARGIADVAWLRADGGPMRIEDWNDPAARTLIAALYVPPASRALLAIHAGEAPVAIAPPAPRPGYAWMVAADSAEPERGGPAAARVTVAARSVLLLLEAAAAP